VQRFRGGLVFKAYRLLYHSTLGLRVIKKKKKVGMSVVTMAFECVPDRHRPARVGERDFFIDNLLVSYWSESTLSS